MLPERGRSSVRPGAALMRSAFAVFLMCVPFASALAVVRDDGGMVAGLKHVFGLICRLCMILAGIGAVVSIVRWFVDVVKGNEGAGYQVMRWLAGSVMVFALFAALDLFVQKAL